MGLETRKVSFFSAGQPTIRLEGRLHLPATSTPSSAAVIAHPHPRWGGTMGATVVVQIAQTLAERGCVALPQPKALHVIPGADHLFLGCEQDVADQVADCVLSSIR